MRNREGMRMLKYAASAVRAAWSDSRASSVTPATQKALRELEVCAEFFESPGVPVLEQFNCYVWREEKAIQSLQLAGYVKSGACNARTS